MPKASSKSRDALSHARRVRASARLYYKFSRNFPEIGDVPALKAQLDLLHVNLRPEIKCLVRRDNIKSIEDFRARATDAEVAIVN